MVCYLKSHPNLPHSCYLQTSAKWMRMWLSSVQTTVDWAPHLQRDQQPNRNGFYTIKPFFPHYTWPSLFPSAFSWTNALFSFYRAIIHENRLTLAHVVVTWRVATYAQRCRREFDFSIPSSTLDVTLRIPQDTLSPSALCFTSLVFIIIIFNAACSPYICYYILLTTCCFHLPKLLQLFDFRLHPKPHG